MIHPNLQTKLTARLLFVLLALGLLFTFSLNYYLRALMEKNVADTTRLIFSNLLAVQTYVRQTLRPVMVESLPPGAFVIEGMSTSYVTRKVMSDLNMARDRFTYRRVALDPRNPAYGPDPIEGELIATFQRTPGEQMVTRFLTVGGEEFYLAARPVVFEQSCLACHGRPEDAPAVLLARYGAERGFGRQAGEIGGLDMLLVPVEHERAAIRQVTIGFVVVFVTGTLVILGLTHFFFDRIMIQNIGRMGAMLRRRFPEEAGTSLRDLPRSGDEIEGMMADIERFADHLREAREKLSDYAANLEARVQDRTAELSREAGARLADVQLFLDMLALFNQGLDRARLLDRALDAISSRFGAGAAAFHCFVSGNCRGRPEGACAPGLAPPERETLLEGRGVFGAGRAAAPVVVHTAVRGAFTLGWAGPVDLREREQEVLLAVGRQLGIALENLEAVEDLMRRKAFLESIFEGIADPLFLLDEAGGIVHANDSGRRLADRLGAEGRSAADELGFKRLTLELTGSGGTGDVSTRETLLPDGRSLTQRAYRLHGPIGAGRAIVYARDNTFEKTMLARLQQGEKALAVGQLAAGLAHEINNPLGVILCYARLLWDDGRSRHAQDLDIIIRHTLQAQKVLQDLMHFARPKPGAHAEIQIAETAAFIARVFQLRAARQHIRILTDIDPALPPVAGDPAAIEQILTNLVVNAMDALEGATAETPGRVTIRASADAASGGVVLAVADNGPGIPESDRSRIFDPFFTTKPVGRGTGLGLAVVYGLVRDLEGTIDFENRDGAVFTIRLAPTARGGHGAASDT
jgi:signal transduction histidine kinase